MKRNFIRKIIQEELQKLHSILEGVKIFQFFIDLSQQRFKRNVYVSFNKLKKMKNILSKIYNVLNMYTHTYLYK